MKKYEIATQEAMQIAKTGSDEMITSVLKGLSSEDVIHAMTYLVDIAGKASEIVDKVSNCMTSIMLSQEHIDIQRYKTLESAMQAATSFMSKQADRVGNDLTIDEYDRMCQNINRTLELYFNTTGKSKSVFERLWGGFHK